MPKKKDNDQAKEPSNELVDALTARGYRARQAGKSDGRMAYHTGGTRVLFNTLNCPWWTVQRLAGDKVRWYCDVPLEAPIDVVLAIVDSFERAPKPSGKAHSQLQKKVTTLETDLQELQVMAEDSSQRLNQLLTRARTALEQVAKGIWRKKAAHPSLNDEYGLKGRMYMVAPVETALKELDLHFDGPPPAEPEEPKEATPDVTCDCHEHEDYREGEDWHVDGCDGGADDDAEQVKLADDDVLCLPEIDGKPTRCRMVKQHPQGTIDVQRLSDGRHFRVSSLGEIPEQLELNLPSQR